MTKCVNLDFQNLTKNVFDQKWSNLCVPISVTTLLRFAMKTDFAFVDENDYFKSDKILTILTMIVYPRSLAGLNLNPKIEESQFQINDIETLLERIYFEKAEDDNEDEKAVVPIHENIVQNFANIELFQNDDENEEDCLGWITILEKCDGNVRTELKNETLNLEERKKIAIGLEAGFDYLENVGIWHFDRKLENFLLLCGVAKICDFGLVYELTGRKSYRQMGYCRRGSKYRDSAALCKFLKL
ncbi:unnamed protein product [Oikopleura dioica]|uniref:Protein kinase domain-containing protein n=1 Tax=Oikopleura dioica TaxID=34765 RepID=E4Y0D5_OIKDI|nr:unnamed protein product [Oikopleura dioica]